MGSKKPKVQISEDPASGSMQVWTINLDEVISVTRLSLHAIYGTRNLPLSLGRGHAPIMTEVKFP